MPDFETGDIRIAYDVVGEGPPLLLLHGFPQTRVLWNEVAAALSDRFTVVTADLRGYGASSKPAPAPDLSNYSFRAMGQDQHALMRHLGFDRFHLAGHDRGARVAYRMALDAPEAVRTLAVMDIVPTFPLLESWSIEVGKAYFHWTFLAQPAPFAERMIEADPDHFYESCLLGWGGAQLSDFPGLDTYRAAWRDPATIMGMTADYRAALGVDRDHDRADEGRKLACPALVLWGADGVMARLYDVPGIWAPRLDDMLAKAIPGGHFFIDQHPELVTAALAAHLARG